MDHSLTQFLPSLVWIALVTWCLQRHVTALRRYTTQWRIAKAAEEVGDVEVGTTLVAENQRYRYVVRTIMAVIGILIGVSGIIAVLHPALAVNPFYGWFILGYFYLTELLTGWLTVRDLRVLDRIGLIDAWHQERIGLHERISALEAEIVSLKAQLRP